MKTSTGIVVYTASLPVLAVSACALFASFSGRYTMPEAMAVVGDSTFWVAILMLWAIGIVCIAGINWLNSAVQRSKDPASPPTERK